MLTPALRADRIFCRLELLSLTMLEPLRSGRSIEVGRWLGLGEVGVEEVVVGQAMQFEVIRFRLYRTYGRLTPQFLLRFDARGIVESRG